MCTERIVGPAERFIYRVCGIDPERGMTWRTYAVAMMLFNSLGLLMVWRPKQIETGSGRCP